MKKDNHENKMMKPPENKRAKIQINKPVRGFPAGTKTNIRVDKNGIPLDQYWRRRLRDAEIDNCIQIITEKEAK